MQPQILKKVRNITLIVKCDIWQWILSGWWVCQILADRQIAKLLDLLSSSSWCNLNQPVKPPSRMLRPIQTHISHDAHMEKSFYLCLDYFAVKIWQWSFIAKRICICKTSKFNISPEIAVTPLPDHLYCLKSHFLGKIDKVVRKQSFFELCNLKIQSNFNTLTWKMSWLCLFQWIHPIVVTFHICLHFCRVLFQIE